MRKTIEINSKGEAETVEHADVEKHECKHNLIIIENNRIKGYRKDFCTVYETINVYIDCECEESKPIPFVQFFDSPVLSASDNFISWFSQTAPWFVQNGYKITDKRKENSTNEN